LRRTFEVWFYIGVLLAFYGALLSVAGVYQWLNLPATVLAEKHATFWAGIILLLVGGAYTFFYWPRRAANSSPNESQVG
jgi:hypothetical protein